MNVLNVLKWISLSVFISMVVASCSKDDKDDDDQQNPTLTGDLKVKFDHRFGDDAFVLNQEYSTDAGEQLTFTLAKYRISNIKLKSTDGTWWSEEESYYIIDASGTNPYELTLTDIPAGEYTDISYTIGVDSARNVSGAQTGALSPSEGMYWSWNTGYIFIKMEGSSPQSGNGNFMFHIGGFSGEFNALKTNTHSMDHNLSINPDAVPQAHLIVDFKEAFDGHHNTIKVSEMNMIHMPGEGAVKIAENFHGAFSLDHIHD